MNRVFIAKGAVFLFAALCVSPVFAEIPDAGLLNDVTAKFLEQSSTWGGVITKYASWLFWVLATISMVWTFGLMALRKADIGEFFAEFLRFTITTGFFWWLLSHGPAIAMAIINSLRRIGAEAGNLPNALTPSTPMTIGFDIVKKAFHGLSWTHPIDNLGVVLISAAIVISLAFVAANILIALVTAWTMAYAGIFILGFGGARWTSDMAIGYFKAMLGIGLELMAMTLLVGIAMSVVDGFYRKLDGISMYELLLVLSVCVVLALLIHKLPGRVAALAGGGSGAAVGVGTAMSGAAMAAAAMATGGAALAAGAANMAGGVQALMAAISKANASASDLGDSGKSALLDAANGDGAGNSDGGGGNGVASALAAAMGDSDSSTRGSTDSASGSQRTTKGSGAMAATGAATAKIGKGTASPGANLAQGVWDVAKRKATDIKASAIERIGETTGGKVAAAIEDRGAAPKPDADEAQFSEDSLSAGSKAVDAQAEIAAFRDRNSKSS